MAQIIDKQITDYLPLLGKEEKKTLLSVIKSFMHLKSESKRISIEQYNKEIEYTHIHANFVFRQYATEHGIWHGKDTGPCNSHAGHASVEHVFVFNKCHTD